MEGTKATNAKIGDPNFELTTRRVHGIKHMWLPSIPGL
jgi:hypothetical protein